MEGVALLMIDPPEGLVSSAVSAAILAVQRAQLALVRIQLFLGRGPLR